MSRRRMLPLLFTRNPCSSLRAGRLVVASAQLDPTRQLPDTATTITSFVRQAAEARAQVLLLPEAALTGYDEAAIQQATPAELASADQTIREACRAHRIAAVVGMPFTDEQGNTYNSAHVIGPDGATVGRQHKLQLVPTDVGWSKPGYQLNVFHMFGVPCAIIICHDKRFPELVCLSWRESQHLSLRALLTRSHGSTSGCIRSSPHWLICCPFSSALAGTATSPCRREVHLLHVLRSVAR